MQIAAEQKPVEIKCDIISFKEKKTYEFFKRSFDIVCSFLALVFLSPILLITAVAIKIDDGGPVIFCSDENRKRRKNI